MDINMKQTHIKLIGLSAVLILALSSFSVYAEEEKEDSLINMNKDQIKG